MTSWLIFWLCAAVYLSVVAKLLWHTLRGTRMRMPHRWEHRLGLHRVKLVRRVLDSGCEYLCKECVDCGQVDPWKHAVVCDGCGRHPS